MKMKNNDILLAGVGGQGLMLLSAVMGEACTRKGLGVVVGAQHGLSQRSGSISAHVRIGGAHSPLIPYGSADLIIAMEAIEALRYVEYLKDGGYVVMNSRIMHPVTETGMLVQRRRENLPYVTLEQLIGNLGRVTSNIIVVEANRLAEESGNPRTENMVLLGAASGLEGFPLEEEALKEAIRRNVPERTIEANLKAFDLGVKEARRLKQPL
jgi:indolepyruvate ferredoxin oxidoreductase beta subunit